MEENPLGIEDLKKAIKFSVQLAKQIESSGKDGWSWTDSFSFIDELSQTPSLIKSGAQILAELKDLDEQERADLNTYIQVEFDLEDDKVEAIVEDALTIAFAIVSLIQKVRK